MTATEKRDGAALAAVFSLRMLGLFLILPVFAMHATVRKFTCCTTKNQASSRTLKSK